ncbi:MAG: hypothetical protein CMH57_05850 [Myxococcales bacterium]|nr:hypothetical protein [Myxococcales bacterium]
MGRRARPRLVAAAVTLLLLTWGAAYAAAQDCSGEVYSGYACVLAESHLAQVTHPTGLTAQETVTQPIALPFEVTWFGDVFDEACVHTHGVVDFSCQGGVAGEQLGALHAYSAPLSIAGAGSVTYGVVGEAPERRFVVSWNSMTTASGATVTVQAVFFEGTSDAVVQHWSVSGAADPVRVGAVSASGDDRIMLHDGPGPLWDGRAYRISSHLFETPGVTPPQVTFVLPESVPEGAEVTVVGVGEDAEEEALTFAWDLDGDGEFDDASDVDPSFFPGDDGSYRVALLVSDGTFSVVQSGRFEVTNVAPEVTAAPRVATSYEGQEVTFEATASDPVGDALTFTWDFGGGEVTTGTSPEGRHTWSDQGTWPVSVTATDDDGASTEYAFEVTVENVPPQIMSVTAPRVAVEGEVLEFTVEATDPGDDQVHAGWDFGDGSEVDARAAASHAFGDDGDYLVQVTVGDEDGGEAGRVMVVEVANAAPAITSVAPTEAVQYGTYTYTVEAVDPGDDTLSFELANGPRGMTLDGDTLTWTPDAEQARRGTAFVMVSVTDGDGGEALQFWDVSVAIADGDQDGMPDDCERAYGLDLLMDDATGDMDLDGLTNGQECAAGSDPSVFNGPTAPALAGPSPGRPVQTASPALVVAAAHDPDGDALRYTFEVYSSPELEAPVVVGEGVEPAEYGALWAVPVELEENATYWWRARAFDPFVGGAWSEVGVFTVDVVNEPPSQPSPLAPVGDVDEAQPRFVADPVVDPEGDAVVYLFEVFSDEALTTRVAYGQTTGPSWIPSRPLEDDARYWWRVSTEDERGAGGTSSEPVAFALNTANDLPEVPRIVEPEAGFESPAQDVQVTWEVSPDRDGDPVTYTVQVSESVHFDTVVFEHEETFTGEEGSGSVVVPGLDEDVAYHVRVRAADPFGATQFARRPFSINAINTPPVPPQMLSPANADRTRPGAPVQLVVKTSRDPDGDPVTYTFQVFADTEMSELVFKESGRVPLPDRTVRSTFTPPNEAKTYTWLAVAEDGTGATPSVTPRTFSVVVDENRAPKAPLSLMPILSAEVTWGDLTLAVKNAEEPDGDPVTYTFQVFADAELTELVWERADVTETPTGITSTRVTGLEGGAEAYYWLAFATDQHGLAGASTDVARFVEAAAEPLELDTPEPSSGGCSAAPGAPRGLGGAWVMLALALGATLRRR